MAPSTRGLRLVSGREVAQYKHTRSGSAVNDNNEYDVVLHSNGIAIVYGTWGVVAPGRRVPDVEARTAGHDLVRYQGVEGVPPEVG